MKFSELIDMAENQYPRFRKNRKMSLKQLIGNPRTIAPPPPMTGCPIVDKRLKANRRRTAYKPLMADKK